MLAESDDVEIGKVVNSRGKDVPLDVIFEKWRGQLVLTSIRKKKAFETARLFVDSLRYTQASCSS